MYDKDEELERHLALRDAGKMVEKQGLAQFLCDLEDYVPLPYLVLVRLYASKFEEDVSDD